MVCSAALIWETKVASIFRLRGLEVVKERDIRCVYFGIDRLSKVGSRRENDVEDMVQWFGYIIYLQELTINFVTSLTVKSSPSL